MHTDTSHQFEPRLTIGYTTLMDDQQLTPTGQPTTLSSPNNHLPPSQSAGSGPAGKANQPIGKIVVDRELCIGAASCLALAAKTFELDAENKAVVMNPSGDSDEDIRAAAASCPTNAIFLYDEEGNQVYPPK